jgi:hypothetical protein
MKLSAVSRPVLIDVKLHDNVSEDRAARALSLTPGLRSSVRVFPDELDPALRSLFMLEVEPKALNEAVRMLEMQPEIEFVHENASRKLIR